MVAKSVLALSTTSQLAVENSVALSSDCLNNNSTKLEYSFGANNQRRNDNSEVFTNNFNQINCMNDNCSLIVSENDRFQTNRSFNTTSTDIPLTNSSSSLTLFNDETVFGKELALESTANNLMEDKISSEISVLEASKSETVYFHPKTSGSKKVTLMLSSNSLTSTASKSSNTASLNLLKDGLLDEEDSIGRSTSLPPRKPPRKFHYTDIRQMVAPTSMMASTSASGLPLRQQQPIRIAHPPPLQHQQQQNRYAAFKPHSFHHQYQNSTASSSSIPANPSHVTTTFHTNPADGLTTMLPNQIKPGLLSQQQHHFVSPSNGNYQESSNSTLPNLTGSTSFPSTSIPNFPHYESAPTLQLQSHQRLHQQKPSTSSLNYPLHSQQVASNSLLRQQRVPLNQQSSPDSSKSSQQNLFELACAQQRQIDANTCELEERRRLISSTIATVSAAKKSANDPNGGSTVIDEVRNIKTQIEHDEKELAYLSSVQREARRLNTHNQNQRRELMSLESAYEHDDSQLRMAVEKVDSLKKQLDLLYQRRASAASAAIAQQRKVNGEIVTNSNNELPVGRKPLQHPPSSQLSLTKLSTQQRPQASVVPFQLNLVKDDLEKVSLSKSFDEYDAALAGKVVKCDQINISTKKSRAPPPPFRQQNKDIPIQHYDESHRFLARGKPDQLSLRADSLTAIKRRSWAQANEDNSTDNIWRYLVEEQRKGRTHVSFADIMAARKIDNCNNVSDIVSPHYQQLQQQYQQQQQQKLINDAVLEKPQKEVNEPSTTFERNIPVANVSTSVTLLKSSPKKEIIHKQSQYEYKKPQDKCDPAVSSIAQISLNNNVATDANTTDNSMQQSLENTIQNSSTIDEKMPPNESPQLSSIGTDDEDILRNESSGSDTSNTTTVEVDDNESRNSVGSNSEENLPNNIVTLSTAIDKRQSSHDSSSETTLCEDNGNVTTATISETAVDDAVYDKNGAEDDDEGFDGTEEPPEFLITGMEEASSTTTDEASSTVSAGDEPVFDEQSLCSSSKTRSILRSPIVTHHKRHVVFDQTVLFLDVAYEGEYETLVELAHKIPDISVANGEGITALHNAICAGNHDIVKFLIDSHADVNALDLDGWSPLHCAATCNNLVMLKQLIDNGACIFSTTLSKSETAADLFDATHELFEPCADYIDLVENCMGVVNDQKVYTAFSYDAEQDDELDFEEGDEIRVIERCESVNNLDVENVNGNIDSDMGSESLWWLCEHIKGERAGKKGLVPRNYLSLYPIWKHRERHNFQSFELPMHMATSAFQRRRRLMHYARRDQEEQNFALFQWSNITSAAAVAAAAKGTDKAVIALVSAEQKQQISPETKNASHQLSTFA